ncbi:MAG: glutaredoxin domain-containing protein, partial [Nannocystaceae bacterium]
MTWTCPYCTRVLKTIGTLDLQVELLDITADETARDALAKQIGR